MAASTSEQRGPGRPAQISRDRIVAAAAAVPNLDALTMRQVAAALRVSHGALYRWVKNRDELFDLISEVLTDRVLEQADEEHHADWRRRLIRVAWAMHDQFLVLPGYATHLSRPHRHNVHSLARLRHAVAAIFLDAGVEADLAEESWYIFVVSIVSWLALLENPLELGPSGPRFELFLDVLVRGLPARRSETARPPATAAPGAPQV
jgi:AcrR family transcriptional regulator